MKSKRVHSLQQILDAARREELIEIDRHRTVLLGALKDAVSLIDLMTQRAGKRPLPLLDGPEVKRLEAARLLSLGI